MDDKAQYEIREYAATIGDKVVGNWVPLTWEAFRDYRIEALTLSSEEVRILSFLNSGQKERAREALVEKGILRKDGETVKPSLEGREFMGKLDRLGMKVPWEK